MLFISIVIGSTAWPPWAKKSKAATLIFILEKKTVPPPLQKGTFFVSASSLWQVSYKRPLLGRQDC